MTQLDAFLSHTTVRHALLATGVALILITSPGYALAKRSASDTATTANTSSKKKSVSKVTYQRSSSEETPAQRDRRMYRECKGMHNAGACRGYTK